MAHFYLDLLELGETLVDDEAFDAGDVPAARNHAIAGARSIMKDDVGTGLLHLGRSMIIRGATGLPVLTVSFSEALTVIPA